MKQSMLWLILVCTFIAACSQSGLSVTTQSQESQLILPSMQDQASVKKILVADRPTELEQPTLAGAIKDNDIINQYCNVDVSRQAKISLIAVGLATFVQPIVNMIIDSGERALQKEIDKYTSVSTASQQVAFYSDVNPLATSYRCFRFIKKGDPDTDTGQRRVELDFIGRLGLNENMDAIELMPVRLFLRNTSAKTRDGNIGVSVELSATAVYRDELVGAREDIFKQVIGTAGGNLTRGPIIKYYEGIGAVFVPIIPVSSGTLTKAATETTFTMNVAEAGTKSKFLNQLLTALKGAQDDLSVVLADAIKAKAGLTEDD